MSKSKKGENKKGRRRGDDSDDEDEIKKQLDSVKEEKEKDSKKNKKDKNKNAGGNKKAQDDDDDDPLSIMKKLAQQDDDSDDGEKVSKAKKQPEPVKDDKDSKKNKKDKNKNKKSHEDDDDDEDPLAIMKKIAQQNNNSDEDEDDDNNDKAKNPKKQSTPSVVVNKKDKKKQKNKNRKDDQSDDDDDEDPLDIIKKLANIKEDPDDEDYSAKDKKKKDKNSKNKSDNKKKPDNSNNKKNFDDDIEKEDEEEEEDLDDDIDDSPVGNTSNLIPTTSKIVTNEVKEVKKDNKEELKEEKKEVKGIEKTIVKPVVEKELVPDMSKLSLASSAPKPITAATPIVTPPPVPVEETEKKGAKKSKLELKLEKAKKDKEIADAILLEEKRKKEEEDKKLEAERKIIEAEKKRLEDEEKKKRLEEQQDDDEDGDEDDDEEEDEKVGESNNDNQIVSTMFGDEVFSEYSKHTSGNEEGSSSLLDSKKKMSNKAKRKLLKEQEAKDREDEYNKLAMKKSIEGQQFAVSQSIVDINDPQWQNALDIIIPNLSISAHNKELFVNTEFNIVHGRRYGLVGPNGAGKSTLLKMIAAGELKVPPRVDYLYVEQEVMADETSAVDAVLKADKVRWALVQEEKQLLVDLEKKADEAKDVRLGEIYEQLAAINASSAESRARRILFGLGFDAEMQIRSTKFFSGGWRMRISLARALFIEPTLLMLDEPTNHLDLNAVIWLDDYLQKWKKTLLVVSHDQDFLNSVCQEIIHLDDKKLVSYKGNYDNFKEQEATKRKQQLKEYEKQEKKLRELKAKGVTKQNAEKEQIKSKSREPGARSKKQEAASMASGGAESGESQVQLIKRPRDYTVVFSFPEVIHLSPPILEVRDVNFRYNANLPWLFRGLNFGIDMSSRICIVGPNGSGKSTVIKLITGECTPPEGEVRRNPRLRVGVYNQHFVDRLPMEEDPVTYLRRLFNEETYQSCRNRLGKYGLEGHAHTIPIRDLSGGQKARVVFVELSLMAPHLLFLDEPTNNLDIESIDALCDALKEFNGGVVIVSHDARLIESIECQLWVVEDQNVTPWSEGFTDYRQHLLDKLEQQLAAIMPGSGERPT